MQKDPHDPLCAPPQGVVHLTAVGQKCAMTPSGPTEGQQSLLSERISPLACQ